MFVSFVLFYMRPNHLLWMFPAVARNLAVCYLAGEFSYCYVYVLFNYLVMII